MMGKRIWVLWLFCCMVAVAAQAQDSAPQLKIKLSRDVFMDDFTLLFGSSETDSLPHHAALKIDEGYVSISSLSMDGNKKAIASKALPASASEQVLDLFVKGYANGPYRLEIKLDRELADRVNITLVDKLLQKKVYLREPLVYNFDIDTALANSQGKQRFSLLISKSTPLSQESPAEGDLLAFPNPFIDRLHLNTKNNAATHLELRLIDLLGRLRWKKTYGQVSKNEVLEIPCQGLRPGLYVLEWRDMNQPSKLKTIKVIKI